MSAEARLQVLGITLPEPPTPGGRYVPFRRIGNLLYLSGQAPRDATGKALTGLVGAEIDLETARHHARLTGLSLLSVTRQALGSLDRVEAVVKLLGMVRATPDFGQHPAVINGCSDLFVEVFGEEIGSHARSAVGMGSLPGGITVEIEAILAVRGD